MLSLAAVYASFGVTLLMRPLGSALFGRYADRKGRKAAIIASMVGVGVSTAAFGLLPTVATVGAAAPVLFILLRLVQGARPAGTMLHVGITPRVVADEAGIRAMLANDADLGLLRVCIFKPVGEPVRVRISDDHDLDRGVLARRR